MVNSSSQSLLRKTNSPIHRATFWQTMNPFQLFQKSSEHGDQYIDADLGYASLKNSASRSFRSRSLPSRPQYGTDSSHLSQNQSNLSCAKCVSTVNKLEASRRLSAPWTYSPEYCVRPFMLEPVFIVAPPRYYIGGHYSVFRPCWRPEHIVWPHAAVGAGPKWTPCATKVGACSPVSARATLHLSSGKIDATSTASPFPVKKERNQYSSTTTANGKHFRTRGKDVCKRRPRTCKHCQQSTCKGASTRRSEHFRCQICPKCLKMCAGRCNSSTATDSNENRAERQGS